MKKVQLTLTSEEADILVAKAAQLGYSTTRYIKFIISREVVAAVEKDKIPTFQMSRKAQNRAIAAQKEYKEGKTHSIGSFKQLAKQLSG